MAGVEWVKITTGMFDNRKIKHLRRLPDGNNIVLIWVMLLTMAGRCNAGGMIFLTENIPYTPKMLADELDFEENTVILALNALEQLQMIVTDGACFRIAGWEEYQNIEGLDRIREQTRKRVAAHRQRQAQKALPDGNDTCNVTVTQGNAGEKDSDSEKDSDKKEEIRPLIVSKDTICSTDVQRILDKWNGLGLSQVRAIQSGTQRYNLLKKRIKDYGSDAVLEAVGRIQKSSFLMGSNKNGWVITFDWFIKPNNFAKVLDGNYDDGQAQARRERVGNGRHHGMSEEQSILEGVGDWY